MTSRALHAEAVGCKLSVRRESIMEILMNIPSGVMRTWIALCWFLVCAAFAQEASTLPANKCLFSGAHLRAPLRIITGPGPAP